jgi:ArsR family transcriptional regulator
MPEDSFVYDLSDFFKVLGDSTRIRILHALSLSEMCVCDLSCLLGMNQSAVSHQLKVLKMSRLVRNRKDGKVAYYMLADEHVRDIFECGALHITEKK